eukprot:3534778-Pyramimonas_sp.AAC.1
MTGRAPPTWRWARLPPHALHRRPNTASDVPGWGPWPAPGSRPPHRGTSCGTSPLDGCRLPGSP